MVIKWEDDMKKVRLKDANDNVLLPTTDWSCVKNVPITKNEEGVEMGSTSLNFDMKFPLAFFNCENFFIGSSKKISIDGHLYLADPETSMDSTDLENYPIDPRVLSCFADLFCVVIPVDEAGDISNDCLMYPGFHLYTQQGFSLTYYFDEKGHLHKLDESQQFIVYDLLSHIA